MAHKTGAPLHIEHRPVSVGFSAYHKLEIRISHHSTLQSVRMTEVKITRHAYTFEWIQELDVYYGKHIKLFPNGGGHRHAYNGCEVSRLY